MSWKGKCRENNCACVDCFEVNDIAMDPCQKYCETNCRGEGKPLYEGPDHTQCYYYKEWTLSKEGEQS